MSVARCRPSPPFDYRAVTGIAVRIRRLAVSDGGGVDGVCAAAVWPNRWRDGGWRGVNLSGCARIRMSLGYRICGISPRRSSRSYGKLGTRRPRPSEHVSRTRKPYPGLRPAAFHGSARRHCRLRAPCNRPRPMAQAFRGARRGSAVRTTGRLHPATSRYRTRGAERYHARIQGVGTPVPIVPTRAVR